jgi:ribosomal protein S18 acetylase RimI-like enzyme
MATESPAKSGAAAHAAIESQFLDAVARGAEIVETPAFRVHLWPRPGPFYRNVAVPTRRPVDWQPAIAAMQAAFVAAGRVPRLEYLEDRWPDLGPALDAAGLVETGRLRVMVTDEPPAAVRDGPPVRFMAAVPSGSHLEAYLMAVQEAFEQPVDAQALPGEIAQLRAEIAAGGCRIATIMATNGGILAGASLIGIGRSGPHGAGLRIAELAGVWTAVAERGRGLATRVAAGLVDRFVAGGDALVWLAAETERTAALYGRLGFQPIGWQRNYSAPAA